jgi:outer membrane receptor protein involved in Fe transport
VVLNDSASGYECMSNDQYNQTFSGPSGGGLGRYHDAHLQDYHARVKQRIGPTQLIVDGYVDNYGYDNVKGPFPHHHYTDIYRTHGFLVSDEFATGKNYVTAGTFLEHQQHIGFDIGAGSVKPDLQTTANNYFVRDTYSPNLKFTTFLDLSEQSIHSQGAFFDPRLSFVYHATANDVVRLTAGRSTSIPDPSNIYGGFSFVDPGSWNLDTCPASGLIQVGSGSSSTLKPESANDYEMAYGHRFNRDTVVQLNLYSSHETNPLINALFPLSSTVPGSELPSNFYASSDPADPGATIQGKLNAKCGAGYGTTHLGVQTLFNAGSAKYQGGDVGATVGVLPNIKVNGDYAVQSASYNGVPDYILQSNTGMINGQQLWYIPLHRASLGIGYSDSTGFATRIDGYYVGMPNEFQRPAFMYANFNISKSFPTGVTVNLGVNNLFNSAAQQYGFFGYGQFRPQNQYGCAANAFDEASEEFGLPYRQLWFTVTQKI